MPLASAGVFADGSHCNEQRRLVNELLWRHDQVCDKERTCACEVSCVSFLGLQTEVSVKGCVLSHCGVGRDEF